MERSRGRRSPRRLPDPLGRTLVRVSALPLLGAVSVAALAVGRYLGCVQARVPESDAVAFVSGFREERRNKKSRVSMRIDRKRLEDEANWSADVFNSVTQSVAKALGMTKPEMTEEEKEELQRREERSIQAEEMLKSLRLAVPAGEDDNGETVRRAAPISVLQEQGEQSLAIFGATTEEALTDVLLSMRIAGKQITDKNILIVPVLISEQSRTIQEFSPLLQKSKLLKQVNVALPAGGDKDLATWGTLFSEEFDEAVAQGSGDEARATGLAMLVQSNGMIVRRGVGRPVWSTIFQALDI